MAPQESFSCFMKGSTARHAHLPYRDPSVNSAFSFQKKKYISNEIQRQKDCLKGHIFSSELHDWETVSERMKWEQQKLRVVNPFIDTWSFTGVHFLLSQAGECRRRRKSTAALMSSPQRCGPAPPGGTQQISSFAKKKRKKTSTDADEPVIAIEWQFSDEFSAIPTFDLRESPLQDGSAR